MNKRLILAIGNISLVLTASCGKQPSLPQGVAPPNAAPARQEDKVDSVPFLEIVSRQELSFGSNTKAIIWNVRGQKIKELTARLLVCTDGHSNKNNEITCRWQEMSKPMIGQLIFLVQDGQPFGAKGKRLPSLSLSFQAGGPNSKAESSSMAVVASDLGRKMSTASDAGTLGSEKQMIYAEIAAPLKEGKPSSLSVSLNGTEDTLVEASKNGGVAMGVSVEWKRE